MKLSHFAIFSAASLFSTVAVHAQTIVSFVGITTTNQEPGSASDFINFYSGDYPQGGPSVNQSSLSGGTITSDLTSFTIQGGVRPLNSGNNNFSTITTPAGQTFLTGAIVAEPGIAFAVTPGVNNGSAFVLNPNFNYNDFNIYLMFSNTNNTQTDGNNPATLLSDAVISVDPRGGSTTVPFGTHDQVVTDNTNATTIPGVSVGASPTTAQYIEFHVTGLGDAIAASPGADLVVSANLPSGIPNESYIGGVSFQSNAVPEPSTYALLLGGLGGLFVLMRARAKLRA